MKIILPFAFLMLAACSTSGVLDYHPYLEKKGIRDVSDKSFTHCHGYNCRLKSQTGMTEKEWKQIESLFKNATSPEQERAAIAQAIGQLEKIIGEKTGTATDVAGTYVRLGDDQHDCVDESVNTTVYLDLLKQRQLLKHHEVSNIATRIPIMGGGLAFHQTAVVVDKETDRRFAVDSWFQDNGHDAAVVPLKDWLRGWHPPE